MDAFDYSTHTAIQMNELTVQIANETIFRQAKRVSETFADID